MSKKIRKKNKRRKKKNEGEDQRRRGSKVRGKKFRFSDRQMQIFDRQSIGAQKFNFASIPNEGCLAPNVVFLAQQSLGTFMCTVRKPLARSPHNDVPSH